MNEVIEEESTIEEIATIPEAESFSKNTGVLTEKQAATLHKIAFDFAQNVISSSRFSANVQTQSSDECRICRESESKEQLLSPCLCRGTLKFIHMTCLQHWLIESDSTKCELCSYQYQTIRTPKYNIFHSVFVWLKDSRHRYELLFDLCTIICASPTIIVGTCATLQALDQWYPWNEFYVEDPELFSCRAVQIACMIVLGSIDSVFISWSLLRVQYHFLTWYHWWRRNSEVKIVLPGANEQIKQDDVTMAT